MLQSSIQLELLIITDGKLMDFNEVLRTEILRTIGAKSPIISDETLTTVDAISLLHKKKRGCILVMDGEKLTGICTERDIMTKVIEVEKPLDTPIKEIMTANPQTLELNNSIEDIIELMHKGGYRHVPIVENGHLIGYISVKNVVDYLAETFPHGIFNLPPNFKQTNISPEGA